MRTGLSLVVAAAVAVVAPARGAVLIDSSAMTGSVTYGATNADYDRNYLDRFTLTTAAVVTAFDVFTDASYGTVGQAVTVKLRSDAGGAPAATNLIQFASTLSAVDPMYPAKEVEVRFAGIPLAAGTYWFGVSGAGNELSTILYATDAAGSGFWELRVNTLTVDDTSSGFRIPFRVIGDAAAVPEPATWTLLIAGFGMSGAALRRRTPVAIQGVC